MFQLKLAAFCSDDLQLNLLPIYNSNQGGYIIRTFCAVTFGFMTQRKLCNVKVFYCTFEDLKPPQCFCRP